MIIIFKIHNFYKRGAFYHLDELHNPKCSCYLFSDTVSNCLKPFVPHT